MTRYVTVMARFAIDKIHSIIYLRTDTVRDSYGWSSYRRNPLRWHYPQTLCEREKGKQLKTLNFLQAMRHRHKFQRVNVHSIFYIFNCLLQTIWSFGDRKNDVMSMLMAMDLVR